MPEQKNSLSDFPLGILAAALREHLRRMQETDDKSICFSSDNKEYQAKFSHLWFMVH